MHQIKADCHAITDPGKKRTENEDQYLLADLVKAAQIQSTSLSYDDQTHVAGQSHGKVLLVADGMGGHAAGRRASTVAVDEAINFMVDRMRWHAFSKLRGKGDESKSLSEDLSRTLKYCQQRIQNEAEWNADKEGMGSTLTIAIVDWPAMHVVHAGDSRCYLYRDGELIQLTRDHTVAQVFVDAGHLSQTEGDQCALSNALWNVVGGSSEELDPDVYHRELDIGDTILLCTDGLTKHLSDDQIADILKRSGRAQRVCEELVTQANQSGGSDNITVAIARFLDPDDTPSVFEGEKAKSTVNSAAAVERFKREVEPSTQSDQGKDSERVHRWSGRLLITLCLLLLQPHNFSRNR